MGRLRDMKTGPNTHYVIEESSRNEDMHSSYALFIRYVKVKKSHMV